VGDLNQSLIHFASVQHYESELHGAIMPMLDRKFDELDETSAAVLTRFFAQVRRHRAHHQNTF
jgi:hypothetical protein